MEKVREFLESPTGKAVAGGVLLLAAVLVFFSVRSFFGGSEAGAMSRERIFIDSKTNKPFEYTLKVGDQIPVKAPSGELSGYPAELCYWTKDGSVKKEPTPVLLKQSLGEKGPTFCPDCGRLVVGHNPMPGEGDKPPPTQSEYKPRGGRGRE